MIKKFLLKINTTISLKKDGIKMYRKKEADPLTPLYILVGIILFFLFISHGVKSITEIPTADYLKIQEIKAEIENEVRSQVHTPAEARINEAKDKIMELIKKAFEDDMVNLSEFVDIQKKMNEITYLKEERKKEIIRDNIKEALN